MTIQWARYYFHIKVRKTSHTQDHKTERAVLCLKLIVRHSSPSDFYLSLMRSQFLFNSKYTNWITLGLILRLFILSSQSLSRRAELMDDICAPHVMGDRVPFSCSLGDSSSHTLGTLVCAGPRRCQDKVIFFQIWNKDVGLAIGLHMSRQLSFNLVKFLQASLLGCKIYWNVLHPKEKKTLRKSLIFLKVTDLNYKSSFLEWVVVV